MQNNYQQMPSCKGPTLLAEIKVGVEEVLRSFTQVKVLIAHCKKIDNFKPKCFVVVVVVFFKINYNHKNAF